MGDKLPRATVVLLVLITLIAIVPRYYRLDKPLLIFHAWRQCDTAAIARNIYRSGFDFLHPRIDYRGNGPNLAETECQIYGLLVALAYGCVGIKESVGRLLSLFFYMATAVPLLFLANRVLGPRSLPWTLFFFLATPMSIVMSTAFQPDAMMLFFLVLSIALFWHFLESDDWRFGLFSSMALSLAMLVKLSSAHVGLVFLGLALTYRGLNFIKCKKLWAIAICSLIPPLAWYSYASTFPVSFKLWTLGPQHLSNWFGWLSKDYQRAFRFHFMGFTLTEIVFFLGLFGIIGNWFTRRGKGRKALLAWFIALLAYMALTSKHMTRHSYYCLPALPLFSILAAWLPTEIFERLGNKSPKTRFLVLPFMIVGLVAPVCLRTYGAIYPGMYILKDVPRRILLLAKQIKERTAPDELVITSIGHGRPEVLYYADRRGWHVTYEQATRERILKLHGLGAKWFALLQPRHTDFAVKDGDKRSVLPLVHRFYLNEYNFNYCAGEGYRFVTVLPLDHWLTHGPKVGSRNFVNDVFTDIRAAIHSGQNVDEMARVLGLQAFILPPPKPNEDHFRAVRKLISSPRWRLIHFEDAGFIFLLAEGKSKERALREAYDYIDPLNRYGQFCQSPRPTRKVLEKSYDEARRAYEKSRYSLSCALVLAFMCSELGRFDEGYQVLDCPIVIGKAPRTCLMNLAIFALQLKQYSLARQHAKTLLSKWPDDTRARALLNQIDKESPQKQ